MAIAADPAVNEFSNVNDAGKPKDQRDRNRQRHAQADVPDASRAAMNATGWGDAVNGFAQFGGCEARCDV